MGTILWQSIQVPAKNSIKIKSFCLGIFVGDGVSLAIGDSAVMVKERIEGLIVCEELQENVTNANTKPRKQSRKSVFIFLYCI
jgi:hypothetical protein